MIIIHTNKNKVQKKLVKNCDFDEITFLLQEVFKFPKDRFQSINISQQFQNVEVHAKNET